MILLGRIGRYLVREVALAWLAVTLVLLVVLLTNRLVRFLSDAVSGDVPPEAVFTLLGLKALSNLGTVLPASFFLAVMLALGRLYRDSEMTAMTACGVGPGAIYRALYAVALPLALIVSALALHVMPWAESVAEQTLQTARQAAQFRGVTPGRFVPFGDGRAVVYVGEVADDGTMRDVFVRLDRPGGRRIVTAESARRLYLPETGDEYLVLESGERYDLPAGPEAGWRITAFAEHGVRLDDPGPVSRRPQRDERSSPSLWAAGGRADLAELHWRVAMPLATVVLTFIALPLARTGPREGRYAKLVGSVLIYVVYFNLLKVGQDWLEDGVVPVAVGLWWVHGLFAAAGGALLVNRYRLLARPRRATA